MTVSAPALRAPSFRIPTLRRTRREAEVPVLRGEVVSERTHFCVRDRRFYESALDCPCARAMAPDEARDLLSRLTAWGRDFDARHPEFALS